MIKERNGIKVAFLLNPTVLIYSIGPGVCELELEIAEFMLKDSPYCWEEYLEVEGSRLCGNLQEKTKRKCQ